MNGIQWKHPILLHIQIKLEQKKNRKNFLFALCTKAPAGDPCYPPWVRSIKYIYQMIIEKANLLVTDIYDASLSNLEDYEEKESAVVNDDV